jgi:hypothetical protein
VVLVGGLGVYLDLPTRSNTLDERSSRNLGNSLKVKTWENAYERDAHLPCVHCDGICGWTTISENVPGLHILGSELLGSRGQPPGRVGARTRVCRWSSSRSGLSYGGVQLSGLKPAIRNFNRLKEVRGRCASPRYQKEPGRLTASIRAGPVWDKCGMARIGRGSGPRVKKLGEFGPTSRFLALETSINQEKAGRVADFLPANSCAATHSTAMNVRRPLRTVSKGEALRDDTATPTSPPDTRGRRSPTLLKEPRLRAGGSDEASVGPLGRLLCGGQRPQGCSAVSRSIRARDSAGCLCVSEMLDIP